MSVTLSGLKEFWKLPESRQLASVAFIAIGALASVIVYRENWHEKKYDRREVQITETVRKKDSIIESSGALSYSERIRLQRECDSEKVAERDARILALEAQYDEAIKNAIEARNVQKRSIRNVKTALKEVAK